MKKAVVTLVLMLAAGMLTSAYSTCTSDCINILFIGNSFTHGNSITVTPYNNVNVHDFNGTGMGGVPAIFQKLAADGGQSNLAVNIEAVSGQTLAWHLANRSGVITNPGAYGPWDWVVLQDFSTRPTSNTDVGGDVAGFRSNVQSFNNLATNDNPAVKTLLYCTWARPDLVAVGSYPSIQSMQSQLTTNYSEAARDFNLYGFAPVGDAFMSAVASGLSINPNITNTPGPGQINLWQFDKYHASTEGSFLAALVFYAKILGTDPRSLPTGPGSAASSLGLDSNVVVQLQQIAYEMVLGSTGPGGDFSLAVDPNAQTITVSSNAVCTVTVLATNGFTGEVLLSVTGLPTNASFDFSPASVTGSAMSTLTLTTSTNTPPGSYPLTVLGTSSNVTHTSVITLTIKAPDFALAVTPSSGTVSAGSNAVYMVSAVATNGFTGEVLLSVTGLPSNVTSEFSSASVTNSGSSTLILVTSTNAPPGSYPLTVTGMSSETSHTFVVTLSINPTPFQGWQMQYFGCVDCAQAGSAADPDGDGMDNLHEFLAGTDPTNNASSLRIISIVPANTDMMVAWTTGPGKTNALQSATGAGDGSYQTNNFADIYTVTDTVGTVTNYLDPGAATNSPSLYYRVRLVP